MSANVEVKLPLNVMISEDKTKVLFAEVDNHFTDILLSFLTLPLGRILKLFKTQYGDRAPNIESLTALYHGLENLDDVHFREKRYKEMLLDPVNTLADECGQLKLNLHHTPHAFNDRRGFVKETVTFLITDDLQMAPNTSLLFVSWMHNLGITKMDDVQQRTLLLGLNEIIDLLKGSMLSQTPLTDLVLHKGSLSRPFKAEHDTSNLLHNTSENEATLVPHKFIVKAMLQISTNKLLFVQSRDDFVDFLFSLLTIPLGSAARLLGNGSFVGCFCNLYKGLASFDNKTQSLRHMKTTLLERLSTLRWQKELKQCRPLAIVGGDTFVKNPSVFMVRDDLTVLPWSVMSSVAFLNEMKVPLQDLEEIEIEIGEKEGLRILEACFTTSNGRALTDALKPFLMKQPKHEIL